MTVARLQRYALFLAGFEYTIEYKNTTQHGNADGLSRLPLKKASDKEVVDPVESIPDRSAASQCRYDPSSNSGEIRFCHV